MKRTTNLDNMLYSIRKAKCLKKQATTKFKVQNILMYFIAFLIPCILYSILLYLKDIYPFGDFSNCRSDLHIQYYDFFCYLKNIFNGEAGIEYTFTKSIGSSPVALIGYYLLSPLNLLLVLFEKSEIQLFVYIITTIKLGLCGAFSCLFLSKRFCSIPKYYNIVFSTAFAFTQYVLGQITNIMWLDGIYMLPLIMLGVYMYVKESKVTLLCVSIALSIIFCWYIAYMNCIFAVLYFLCELLLSDKFNTLKEIVSKTFKFLLFELLGVMMSLAVFLPVLLSQASGRSFDEGIFKFNTNGKLLDILKGLLIGSPYPSKEITFFCSVLVLLFLFSFLFANINARKKMVVFGLFSVTTSLLFFQPLEHILCGFKYENSYMYRHAYLLIMVVIYIAAMSFNSFHEQQEDSFKKDKSLLYSAIAFVTCLLVVDWVKGFDVKRLWLQIFIISIYAFVLYLKFNFKYISKYKKVLLSSIILAIFLFEIMFNAHILFQGYVFSASNNIEYTIAQQETVDNIKSLDKEFYRIENTYNRGNGAKFFANESLAYGYSTIQSYTSTYESEVASLLIDSGYCTNEFPTFYNNPILPMDSFLGVKYLMTDKNYEGYLKTDIKGFTKVYQNPHALPLAFRVSDSVNNDMEYSNSIEFINSLYSNVIGEDITVLKECIPSTVKQNKNEISYYFGNSTGSSNDILYLHIDNSPIECSVLIDGKKVTDYSRGKWGQYSNIVYVGSVAESSLITISGNNLNANDLKPVFYRLEFSEFERVCSKLKEDAPEIISLEDGYVKAAYNSSTNGNVLFTIPKHEQWEIKVNGELVEQSESGTPFITVPVNSGENVIELTYSVKGKNVGLIISIVSVCILILTNVFNKKRGQIYE